MTRRRCQYCTRPLGRWARWLLRWTCEGLRSPAEHGRLPDAATRPHARRSAGHGPAAAPRRLKGRPPWSGVARRPPAQRQDPRTEPATARGRARGEPQPACPGLGPTARTGVDKNEAPARTGRGSRSEREGISQ